MVTPINPTDTAATNPASLVSTLSGGFNVSTFLTVLVILIFVTLLIFLFKKFKGKKTYDILVEVTPKWSFKKDHVQKEIIIYPTKLQRLLGKKPYRTEKIVDVQSYSTYFCPAAYNYNKKTGTYDLYLKNKAKDKVYGIDYGFFKPIIFGKFKRALGLWQEGPGDFKPYKVHWIGNTQVRNVYDSESTWVALKAQEEVRQKFMKESKFTKYLPVIVVIIMGLVFIAAIYFFSKQITDSNKTLVVATDVLRDAINVVKANCGK